MCQNYFKLMNCSYKYLWLILIIHYVKCCKFDSLYTLKTDLHYQDPILSQTRQLQAIQYKPIRITVNIDEFKKQLYQHQQIVQMLLKVINTTTYFLQKRIKVFPLNFKLKAPQNCVNFFPSQKDRNQGIDNSDLHIYALHINDNGRSFSATGKSCSYFSGSGKYPDITYSRGRPVIGRIIFNMAYLNKNKLNSQSFTKFNQIALHEFIHILGFDKSLFNTFISRSTGNLYQNVYQYIQLNPHRPNSILLKTPKVTKWAQNYFGCNQLKGMLLQNEGLDSTLGSHWQRSVIYDQIMTATNLGPLKALTSLTFALLQDMGWYECDDRFLDTITFGKNKGCDFFNNICYSTKNYEEFCDPKLLLEDCSSNRYSKSICMNVKNYSDHCGIRVPWIDCITQYQNQNLHTAITHQQFGKSSLCVESTISQHYLSINHISRCYNFKCEKNSVMFLLGKQNISCSVNQKGIKKNIKQNIGFLTCPNYTQFCQKKNNICQNQCKSNGYCSGGICNCISGYFGNDCSQKCSQQEIFNTLNHSCVKSCPSTTYQNIYSRSCMKCQNCLQCKQDPDYCIKCLYPLNLYQSKCILECPQGSFNNQFTCQKCSSLCFACSNISTNCTKCNQNSFLYNNICLKQCPKQLYYNKNKMQCVKQCSYYQILSLSECKFCQESKFKTFNQICEKQCPISYYKNYQLKYCQKCHEYCSVCFDKNDDNCFSCNENYFFDLNFTCLQTCPLGTYIKEKQCRLCKKNCDVCNQQQICLHCSEKYFLDSQNNNCVANCGIGYFNQTSTQTCKKCHISCKYCSDQKNSSCKACSDTLILVNHLNNGFCFAKCPKGFYKKQSVCQDCYANCKTCKGKERNDCLSCEKGYLFYNNQCFQTCPIGTYREYQKCEACKSQCRACLTKQICTKCIQTMYLQNNQCVSKCSEGKKLSEYFECYNGQLRLIGLFLMIFVIMLI